MMRPTTVTSGRARLRLSGSDNGDGPFNRPCFYLKLRRSIPAPIEQVVDPHLHHLDVSVADGENVVGEEWRSSRSSKCLAAQSQIIVLELRRPVVRESPLDARAHQPTAVGVPVGASDRCTGRHVSDGEVVVAYPTAADL